MTSIMRTYLLFFGFCTALIANVPPIDFSDESKIIVQNAILAKVNGTTISMMDVKKKMDLVFHQRYPLLVKTHQARYQFYAESWRSVLMELIDHQLILADAVEKEVKLTDGEVREAMEERFGPNVMLTLDQIGLTYEDAWKMMKEEILVQRMTWWFVHAKAISQVTPHDIRQSFRLYLADHPPYQEWKYRVISIRGEHPEEIAEKTIHLCNASGFSPETLVESLQAIDPTIQVSSEFIATDPDLSQAHREALAPLSPGEYSAPKLQISRVDHQTVARIFYLSEKIDHPAPQFKDLSHTLRNELIQQAVAQTSTTYMDKLRKHYGFDAAHLKEYIPEDLHPFSLE